MPKFTTIDGRAGALSEGHFWPSPRRQRRRPSADPVLEAAIEPFRAKTDTVNFPLKGDIPYELIGRIGAFLYARWS